MAHTPLRDEIVITAKSIAVIPLGEGINRLVLFHPTKETLIVLRGHERGQLMGHMRLVDKWDDGSDDVHTSTASVSFIGLSGSGDARKTHTYFLTVIDGTFFNQVSRDHDVKPRPSEEQLRFEASQSTGAGGIRHG